MFISRLFFVFSFHFLGCNNIENVEVDLANSLIIPKKYSVNYIDSEINIDSKDDESQWKKAQRHLILLIFNNKTFTKELHENAGMMKTYTFMQGFMRTYLGRYNQRDAVIFKNNDFEVFKTIHYSHQLLRTWD